MASVYVDVDAGEFDDAELVSELKERGYEVSKEGGRHGAFAGPIDEAAWRLRRGEIEETLLLLARGLGGAFHDLPNILKRHAP
jgi:hypothetical protein